MESDVVSGQQSAWVLLKKLGEGDAGEVYLVESLLEKQPAILKRPTRSAFASDVIRQTSQIMTEAKILRALSEAMKMDGDFPAGAPEVLDQSRGGTAFSDRLFIVIDKAPGFDLTQLARTARLGLPSSVDTQAEQPEEQRFLQSLAELGQTPERVILSALDALLTMFEKIHQHMCDIDGLEVGGFIWNDVKPEHIFWDPWRARLTIIDWGNGQLLDRNGTTRDRRFSAADDYHQWLDEMGKFLELAAPSLLFRLEWPGRGGANGTDPQAITRLQERIKEALKKQMAALAEARDREAALLQRGMAGVAQRRKSSNKKTGVTGQLKSGPFAFLEAIHQEIIGFGELPNYSGALSLALSWTARFASAAQMADVEEACAWAEKMPGSAPDHLRLVSRLAQIARTADTQGATRDQYSYLTAAVGDALRHDWPGALWDLVSALRDAPGPDWWYDLISEVRQQEIGSEEYELHPLLAVRRGLLTLQAMAERLERPGSDVNPAAFARLQELVRRMREEVLPNWTHIDPSPPHSTLAYTEIDEVLEEIQAFLPEASQAINRALAQPRAQVKRVLEDWERGQFGQAAENLRQALLWDPARIRVLRAEHALAQTPAWLEKAQLGPGPEQHYQSFVTEIEYEGRELRSQIGPAGWLDLILEGCRQLRRGAWPPDLFTSLPPIVREMPWLRRFERVERLPEGIAENGYTSEEPLAFVPLNRVTGGKLGVDDDLAIGKPLDAWVPEARGSSARVFQGQLRNENGERLPVAIKLMRMDKVDYALPLFCEEVRVLNVMRGVPGVPALFEGGFINLEEGKFPNGREAGAGPALKGDLIRIGASVGQEFIQQIERRAADGWIPYLAIELRDSRDNLLGLCDASMTSGAYLPVPDLLLIAIQICEILQEAHQRNVVYRDHKILHYYWIEKNRGVYTIDWNVARLHPEGLSEYEIQMDLVQFGARGLHHILTGRTAPGALPLGPTRPDEIEQAAKTYQAQWTYDDQRLPEDARVILERVLAGSYNNAVQLRDDLKRVFLDLPNT